MIFENKPIYLRMHVHDIKEHEDGTRTVLLKNHQFDSLFKFKTSDYSIEVDSLVEVTFHWRKSRKGYKLRKNNMPYNEDGTSDAESGD